MSSSSADYTWLWCDYHAKVTDWFLTLTDRLEHPLFYSSFINAANRSWSTYARDADHKRLQPLDYLFIDCLAEEPIPADMLIEALSGFNRSIGGTKGYLKGKGLIQCENTVPDISTIESAVTELYKKIASYYKNKRAQEEDEEDEEMEDAEVESAEKEKSHSTFEIAIVGGRKQDEDEDMT